MGPGEWVSGTPCWNLTDVTLADDFYAPFPKWATCWDLTDVTLADEDTNSIQTDNANREIQGNVAMQVARPIPGSLEY